MKVLITGGAGFIGSHTADLLLKKGHQVRVLDSLESPVHPSKQRPSYLAKGIEFIQGDVRSREAVEKALHGIEVVFHLAAYQDYLTDFSRFAFVNDGGTALLYETIVNGHLPVRKVVLASSQAVYGEGKYRCPEHGVCYPPARLAAQMERGQWDILCSQCHRPMIPLPTDEARVHPHNQYAVSKYCQELYALTLGQRYGIPTVALRYSITQGPRQSFHNAYSGVLRVFTQQLLHGHPPVIYEDGRQLRDYVYVGDVARANLLVMERSEADYQVFNVGGATPTTVLDYARLLIRLLGEDVEPELPGEYRFGDTRHIFSDSSKLRSLGWKPQVSVGEVAEEYLAWVKAQPDTYDASVKAAEKMRSMGVLRKVGRT